MKKKKTSEWKRKKEGLWIQSHLRSYVHWFKYLQEAEKDPYYKVDWSKYQGWGGANEIIGSKFDDWWPNHWKDLFGTTEKNGTPKFEFSTSSVKSEAIYISYKVWLERNIKPDLEERVSPHHVYPSSSVSTTRSKSNALAISRKLLRTVKRKGTLNLICVWDLEDERNPNTEKDVRDLVNRYLRKGKKYMRNVCKGSFP